MNAILKPSPNETSRMMQDEFQRRRQARILQVREQEKLIAIRIRRAIQDRQKQEMKNLTDVLHKEWNQKHQDALKESEEKFSTGLKDVGKAHEMAEENAPNQALTDALHEQMRKMAEERGKSAIQHQSNVKMKQERESLEMRKRRHIAMIKEKLRARHIASLPPPAVNPADTYLDNTMGSGGSESWSSGSIPHHPQRYTTIQINDHNSTMPTTVSLGLPSDAVVEKATIAESAVDAREEATIEGARINQLQAERDREVQERMEKAKVRHQAALQKARLDQESKSLMDELKQMKMKDALRRQYHIDYTWKDSSRMQQACNDLFKPVGIPESQLLSKDLTESQEVEESTDDEDDYEDITYPSRLTPLAEEEEEAKWEENKQPPGQGRALDKLLKQIEKQREKRKETRNEIKDSTIPESLNSISSIRREKTGDISSTPEDSLDEEPTSSKVEPTSFKAPPKLTEPEKVYSLPIEPTELDMVPTLLKEQGGTQRPQSHLLPHLQPPIEPRSKYFAPQVQGINASTSQAEESSSESILVKSLESVRNDDALLKSVKDFQDRILQQHKSYAKIQQQIERLQEKKANLDGIVSDITKPKTF